jgi:hypothetical protein
MIQLRVCAYPRLIVVRTLRFRVYRVLRRPHAESADAAAAGQLAGQARRPNKTTSARSELGGVSEDAFAAPCTEADGGMPYLLHCDSTACLRCDFRDFPEHTARGGGRITGRHTTPGVLKCFSANPHWDWPNHRAGGVFERQGVPTFQIHTSTSRQAHGRRLVPLCTVALLTIYLPIKRGPIRP